MHHDAERVLLLVLVLLSAHLTSSAALGGSALVITPQHLDPAGDVTLPPDGGAAVQLRGQPGDDGHVTSQAAPADSVDATTNADAPITTCAVPNLGDWVLRHGPHAVCPSPPGDEAAYTDHTAVPALVVGRNVTEAQPSAEPPPVPEVAAEEHLEVGDEERQNFAAAKDGAKIVAANKEAKKAASLLDDDGDTFLKNECKADKFVIIELAQMVKVDTIKVIMPRRSFVDPTGNLQL